MGEGEEQGQGRQWGGFALVFIIRGGVRREKAMDRLKTLPC